MSNLTHVPAVHYKEELVQILKDILKGVEEGDTLEGFVEFTVLDSDTWHVTARYRVGNKEGQGFLRMIGSFEPN